MRIGIELKHLDPLRGGAETYTCQLARWLLDSGHEVHFFVHDSTPPPKGAVVHTVIPFSPSTIKRTSQSADLDFFIGTDKSIGMDLFHPHRGTVRGNLNQEIARIECKLVRGIARVANGINPRYHGARILERRQIGEGEMGPVVIAVSEMIANELRSEFGMAADRLRVVYNGVDCNWFSEEYCRMHRQEERDRLGIAEGDVCYLLVANDFARKGVAQFIRATSLLLKRERSIHSVVVGRPNPRPYERLAARIGCAGRVSFVPLMDDIRNAYAAADVFVLPTWYDPCSLTVLEAWACGLPVVTTTFNGASELMKDGQEGYLIESPGSVGIFADRMGLLLQSEQRSAMGRRGRSLAEQHTLDGNFRRLMEIILSSKRRQSTWREESQ